MRQDRLPYALRSACAASLRDDLGGVEDALLALPERIRQGMKHGGTLACLLEEPASADVRKLGRRSASRTVLQQKTDLEGSFGTPIHKAP